MGAADYRSSDPRIISKHNIQKEINIHNLFTGPVVTPTKAAIEYGFAGALVLYGICYPFALGRSQPVASWLEKRGLPAPPIYLWPFFLAGALLDIQLFSFNEAEVAEILISLALSVLAIHYWILHRSETRSFKKIFKNRTLSKNRSDYIAAVFLGGYLHRLWKLFCILRLCQKPVEDREAHLQRGREVCQAV